MTISLNVILQMIGVAIQALNQVAPFFPPKTKVTIAAVVALLQAIVAFLAHFKNPDGTSAQVAYQPRQGAGGISTMIFPVLIACLLLPSMAKAQDLPADIYLVGANWNQNATPQIGGGIRYLHRLTDAGMYNVEFLDVYSKTLQPFTVAFSFMPGIAQKTFVIDNVPVFLTTAIGPAAGDSNAGYAWTNGIFGVIPIGKKGWRISPEVRWTKTNISTPQQTTNIFAGLSIGWGK